MGATPSTVLGVDNINAASVANPFPVSIQAAGGYSASATFTPAATSHVTPDIIGGAQSFALGAPSGATVRIVSASLLVASGTNETSTWRLYLYSVTPPSALADDATFDLPAGDLASFLGYFDFAQLVDLGSALFIEATPNKIMTLSGTGVFGYLVNLTTLTPAAVAHTVKLNTVPVAY